MPEYKKKNIHKKKRIAKNIISDNIPMQSETGTASVKNKSNNTEGVKRKINVIAGNKLKRRKRKIITVCIAILIVMATLVISIFTPTGIVEYAVNAVAAFKIGNNYPVKLSGGVVNSADLCGNHYFLLSSSNFECYNINGKNIFSYQHGYLSPLMCTSDARTIVYDQSGKNYSVYNLKNKILSGSTEREILTAAISRNGNFAVATLSDSYSSQITVFSAKGEKIYEWFCSEYIVNGVLLSPNGKTLAVSVLSAKNGAFVSKIYFLEFDSATPIAVYDYNELVLGIKSVGNSGFISVCENSLNFFTWKNFKTNTYNTEENINIVKNYKSDILTVSGRSGNKNENNITFFDSLGSLKYSFVFNGTVDSIEYKGNNVFILSENNIYKYTINGEFECKAECEFGTSLIIPVSQNEIAAVTDSKIQKIYL